jgi:hypothetical protein
MSVGKRLSSGMDLPAPDLHSAWLNQVASDSVLTAVGQVIAVVLVRFAEHGTNISQMSGASLAVPTGLPPQQINEALQLLTDRGHLRVLPGRRGKARAFQFVQRARPIVRKPKTKSSPQVFLFPAAARRDVVREISTEILVRPHQAAEAWLN